MSCFASKTAWLPWFDRGNGLRPVFRPPVDGANYEEISLPCRKCDGCRLDIARDYGIRASHEAMMHKNSCFVTLTYDPAHLPFRGMLKRDHLDKFVQDARNDCRGATVRFLGVGEYGSQNWRPHYHVCIFGHDWFADAVAAGKSQAGFPNFESPTLSRLWGKGRVVMNLMGPEVAEYAARYSLKKVGATDGYSRVDPRSGDEYTLPAEFLSASKQLGKSWLEKFALDVFPRDYVVTRKGRKVPVPRYYVRLLRQWCEDDYQALKLARIERNADDLVRVWDATYQRQQVRAECMRARLSFSSRSL
jgi:hypothetical protein